MCGISGVVTEKEVSTESLLEVARFSRELILASEIRGQDGTGLASVCDSYEDNGYSTSSAQYKEHIGLLVDSGHLKLFKTAKKASELLMYKGKELNLASTVSQLSVAQNRLAIFGEGVENQQPLVSDRYVVTHNGNLYDFERVFEEEGLERKLQVDTELILRLLDKYNDPQAIFEKVKGNFACLVIDRKEKCLYAFRRDKPLFMRAMPLTAMFFFSTERIGRKVFGDDAILEEVPEGRVLTFRPS